MARLRVLAFALALGSAVPGEAETGSQLDANALQSISRFGGDESLQIERRGFAFPVIEYTDPAGVRQQSRGIIASKRIAPGTLIGLGFFETAPKVRSQPGDFPSNLAPKRRKRAAIGLSWKF